MAAGSISGARVAATWDAVARLVAAEGSARTPQWLALCRPDAAQRDLADAVHGLSALHGQRPGVLDTAAGTAPVGTPVATWLASAAAAFAGERARLVRVGAAVGGVPSTPGQLASELAIAGQRHALDVLAGSERAGCGMGAALALQLDWVSIAALLDTTGARYGVGVHAAYAPVVDDAPPVPSPGFERAVLFGATQVLAQHRALWTLLAARASARGAA